ncbi:DsbA family protein [Gordonia sp. CPCC 205515]|uniref:mycothiol-dependent nitroreductase Rv2466c family protein n=1 Tax=Gordonia sp. CPCC 205515 TaxID=3140791 RepID=UPI003AF35301
MTEHAPTVDIYVDPACPFGWVTSRWLAGVAERRGVEVTWHQMSLAVLNDGREMDGAHAERMVTSRHAGRLLAATADLVPAKDLYLALGRRLHTEGLALTDDVAAAALTECGLDSASTTAMYDDRWDDAVAEAHRRSQEALGGTGGCPITVVSGRAFFGPVLTEIPSTDEADRLFDGLVALSDAPAFAQMERPRVGPPKLEEAA